jgi:hypothetical protein
MSDSKRRGAVEQWAVFRGRCGGDAGFGLVEAVSAAFVLLLFSAAVAGLLTANLKTSKVDRQRVAASQLAARELEIARDQFARSDAAALAVVGAGLVTNPNPLAGAGTSTLDGVPYTVQRTAAWAVTGTGASACDGGGAVTYPTVRLHVQVTWPAMGAVRPVTSDTIVTPSKKVLNADYAFVAVRVNSFAGVASPGRTITATGPGGTSAQVTDASGCAVFGFGSTGTYDFRFDEAGFVSYYGEPALVVSKSVSKGSFQTFAATYDRAAALDVATTTDPGFALPTPLPPVVVRSAGLPSPGTRANPSSGAVTRVNGLGPYAQGYTVWAGWCPDAEPAAAPTNQTVSVVTPAAGQTLPATARLAPISVQSALPGAQVTATHNTGCSAPTLDLGTTDAGGQLATSLPYGSWIVTVSGAPAPVPVTPAKEGVTVVTA